MSKQLAIMKQVGYGCRDTGRPCLFFSTHIDESSCALQVLFGKDANDVITSSGVYNVKDLEGQPCWVEVKGNVIRFLEIAKI